MAREKVVSCHVDHETTFTALLFQDDGKNKVLVDAEEELLGVEAVLWVIPVGIDDGNGQVSLEDAGYGNLGIMLISELAQ
eukprot:9257070-Ditylum_brightwellii.AAC.1